ncbi:hydrogenase expression/formation protein [Halioxenophilus aromaticivorans]|uniref:Hydrogenase expression/formation protein n=1 Tax=Halioxenophilus aromaticivorans TaxID=1306992 RepID=A0AAV3U9Y7_9ALTE
MSDNDNSIIFTDAMSGSTSAGLTGPGSQPAEVDGAELDILQLPSGMDTYDAPLLPEPEAVTHLQPAVARLNQLQRLMRNYSVEGNNIQIDLSDMDAHNKDLVDQVCGEGEVSILFGSHQEHRIQESVLAGIWRIQTLASNGQIVNDRLEVGPIPAMVKQVSFTGAQASINADLDNLPPGVLNAPSLVAEINEKIETFQTTGEEHTINLTLLPQTEEDLGFLANCLGQGKCTVLSRGYGNCRVTSTNTQNVWWVQYFNSQDKNILNSLEISTVPEVACAAAEDISDSTTRLYEILEIYQ